MYSCRAQHTGFGRRLIVVAELISLSKGLRKMAVIAGVGTRNYYRKFGYEMEGHFLTKSISLDSVSEWLNELSVTLPVIVQQYNTTTDLGTLGATITSLAPSTDCAVEVKVRSRRKKAPKPDVLDEFGDNCASLLKSRPVESSLVYLDRVVVQTSNIRRRMWPSLTKAMGSIFAPRTTKVLVLGFVTFCYWRWTKRH